MRKPVAALVMILVGAVGWIFFNHFTISGLTHIGITPRSPGAPSLRTSETSRANSSDRTGLDSDRPHAPPAVQAPRIRIAPFKVQALDVTKSRKPHVVDLLARICKQFDLIAIQEIQSESDDVLPRIVDLVNQTGEQYDHAIGPRVGPRDATEQYAFIFNRRTLILDRGELYTVDDRDDVLTYEPFVAWFRTIGPKPDQAFTFSVINLRLDPSTAHQERELLPRLLTEVRNDGREEDDVILAADLQAGPGALGPLDGVPDIAFAVRQLPTDVSGSAAWSNLVFLKTATGEFTGNSGVVDFLRRYNLSMDEALEVSDQLPVWAEFEIFEGGQPGRVARRTP
jgi:hypothetical protein